jgi:tRNA nucleotidyltransferase/poly(A) polymerase/predicted GNAT family acetyltransferase
MTYAEFKTNFLPEFLKIKSFNGKIKYANQYLPRIGSGSGRIVYDIDGEKVLKLAKNPKGVGQNEAETGAGYFESNHHILAKVIDSMDDDTWLIAEKAKKVNEARIKQVTGIPSLNDLKEFLKNAEELSKGHKKIFPQSPELEEFFWNKNEFAFSLADFVASYAQNSGDMGRPSTFGEVLRNGKPAIVLTDYGLNDEVVDTHYSGKNQKYQMYELYNFADGNDDMLGDLPPQDAVDTRQAMWGLMPYGVGDGPGVINEDFISFVLNRDKYPTSKLPSAPYIVDEFHDVVNNLKEVLEHVPEKKKFYSNLLELQDYLIRGKFYDREPLEEETVEINESSPKVAAMQLPREYSDTLANAVAQKLNLGAIKYLGGGGYGYAYEVNNNRVLKITTDACEVDAGLKISRGKPKTLAMVYNVYKVTDTEQNKAVYALIEDNIVDKPHQEFERYTEIINSLGEDLYGRLLRILIKGKPKKEDTEFFGKTFNDFPELAKLILTANPDANIAAGDREKAYRFMLGLYDIKRELLALMIKSDDYMTLSNLGYKNGILTYYDIGGCMGVVVPDLPPENRISLPEGEEVLNEEPTGFPREVANKVANSVAQKFGYGQPKPLGDGVFGYAYDIGNNLVLKVTKDQSEANENLELIGKPLEYIAQPYKVYSIKSNTLSGETRYDLYVIILEKLRTDKADFIARVERMKFAFEKIMGANYGDVLDHFIHNRFGDDNVDEDKVQKYFARNPQDREFFDKILKIGEEVKKYGLESTDYTNPNNLGYKPNGNLGFFDVGFGNYFFKSNNMPEPVQVDEDGSALYSTDNSFGQDNFPTYNNMDTSPSISNDLNANSEVNEDLEYNHVVGDATQDEFQITERVQSFQSGSKTVDVKKKCRLGGNGDGTSTACNQGDIGNLTFGSIKESVNLNLPNNLSGYDSLKITDDGQVVGEVGIMDRGVQGQNHYIAIDKIFINKEFRGKGYANDAMKLIFDYADRNKLIVTLTPDSMWGASKSKLTAWYKSLGFIMNKGRNKDFQTMQLMYRLPNTAINEVVTSGGEKYYRAVEKYMGETIEFEPEGYYEAIDDDGNPIYKYDTFWVSETPEIAASKSVGGALMGLYSMFMQHGKNPGVFYVYEINEKPDADISHWEIGDFTYLKEVRFRRAVQGHYIGKVDITDDFKKRMNAFYEINGLEAYDEPDEETSEIFQDTDYEQYLDKMKNTIHEEEFPVSEPQIEKDNTTHELDKKLIRTYNDGIDVNPVYAVNGDEVRDSGFIEWVEGGNHWVDYDLPKSQQKYAKHIPADELWVDDVHLTKPNDFEGILLHERVESYLIKHYGYTYDNAHDIANKVELLFRKRTESISEEGESERISSLMYTAFKKNFKPTGGKKYQMEGVADKYAEKAFNIPDPHAEQDVQAQGEIEKNTNEPVGEVVDTIGRVSQIYKNPKSLERFQRDVRAIADTDGNLYVAQADYSFTHGNIAKALGLFTIDARIYSELDKYQLLNRVDLTNNFGLGDISSRYINSNAHNYDNAIDILKATKRRNPQYEFYEEYYTFIEGEPVSVDEGVADVAAEKMFNVPNPDAEFNDRFNREQDSEDIVYNNPENGLVIIKNPKSWKNIWGDVRGVVDKEGNLYTEQKSVVIHFELLYTLNSLGVIENEEHWDKTPPTNFLTVQRYKRDNIILVGESNAPLYPEEKRNFHSSYWETVPKREEALPYYEKFLSLAKEKNPTMEFIAESIRFYGDNALEESVMNEAEIMSLQDLPFKQEVEQLGGKIYSVGGAVRDEFLGKQSKDLDVLITGVPFEELEQLLGKYGRVDAVGKSFGVLKFKPKGATDDIDIAIPRTETATGEGGHQGFDVKSDHALPIEKDLERRDFTINAIAKDSEGNIVDPFGGQEDLKNKIIRIVNPQAFSDDPLRMLRAVQFASRFGFTIEPQTMQMIKENAQRVKEIAPERILTEFDKIIKKGNVKMGADLLVNTGLYEQIFGGQPKQISDRIADVKTMGEFIYLLAVGTVQSPSEFYKNNLKGDIPTYKEIKALELAFTLPDITHDVLDRSIAHNMYLLSPQALQSQIIPMGLQKASEEFQQGKYPKTVNELAVNGNDLSQLGLQGKAIGDMQKSLLLKVYADKVRNNREDLLALAKQNGEMIKEEVKPTDKIEYGCLMLFLDVPIWTKITSIISPDDVYDEPGYGIETEPHTTILYGFHDEVTSEDCFSLFEKNMPIEPIKIGIKGISFFTGNPKFDVVKFDVESPELTKLNEIMKALPHTSAFPDYHPHITIAYVKPGEGQKYIKPFEKNRMLNGTELVYTWKGHKGNDGDKLMLDGSVDESIADKAAERMFNMPNQSAEQDVIARGAVQAQEEEPVAMVRDRNGKKSPIYENPKSLRNIGPGVRGIIDQEGNLFLAQKDGYFNHGNIGRALGFIEGDTEAMYNYLTEWMLVNRIGSTNDFGLADSSYDFAADEYDYDNIKIVNDFLRAAKRRNPQYNFYPEYYENVKGEPITLNEYSYPETGQEKPTWNVNGQQVDINFFTDKYYEWNQGGYESASDKSVLEFLQNNYEDFSHDEKLKHDLYHKLVDNEVLDEDMNKNVKYTAVVLDDKSRTALLKRLGNMIPEGWETIAHHMTMNLGPIAPEYLKFLGMTIVMEATEFSMDDMVMAVGVVVDKYLTKNKKPHITIAVNRAQGGKPMMSNQLSMWVNLSEPLILTGKVTEVE